MKKLVMLIGVLLAVVIVMRLLTGRPRGSLRQCCARMMENIPDR